MSLIGKNVMVQVSRDKERGGVVVSETKNVIGVEIDGKPGDVQHYNREAVRQMSSKPDIVNNQDLEKVAVKHDTNKNRVELIPSSGIEGIGRAMTFGATKYADHNWAKGFNYSRLIGSAMRHLLAYNGGENKDPESGLSHLDHAGACLAMLIAHESEGLGIDDRRKHD